MILSFIFLPATRCQVKIGIPENGHLDAHFHKNISIPMPMAYLREYGHPAVKIGI